jgi:hypothetical protein
VLDGLEELGGDGTVDDAVVGGEGHAHLQPGDQTVVDDRGACYTVGLKGPVFG